MRRMSRSLLLQPDTAFLADRLRDRKTWSVVVGDNETGRVSLSGLETWADVEAAVFYHYEVGQ